MKASIRKLLVTIGLILIIGPAPYPCGVGPKLFADDIDLERIVVTASRTEEDRAQVSRNVDVTTGDDIERSQANGLAQALTDITSVNISDYGTLGATKTIRMRGSSASQVLVLVDGRPVNNPRDGVAELSNIPLDDIEKVEVVHGPGSNLYGAGAMAGTVNIITKTPPIDGAETELYSSFGTFRTYTERFSHGARASKFGYILSGGYQSSEGYRENSEFDARDMNAKLEYNPDTENALTFNSGFYRSNSGAPGSAVSLDMDDRQENIKNYQDFNWSFKPDDSLVLSMKTYQNYDKLGFSENTAGSAFDTAGKKDIHTTKVRGCDLQMNRQFFENYQGIFGFNYVGNFNDSTSSAKHRYTVRAGYMENMLELFDVLKLNFGARIDDYSNFGTEVNPSFSALYPIGDNIKLRGSISRSFRPPTFNDLYWPDEGWARGNPNVKPEKGLTKEIGIQTEINRYAAFSLAYYRSDYDNLINWAEEAGVWQPKNVDSARIDGIELWNNIKIADNWSLDTGYTYLRAMDANLHKRLIYQPENKVDLSLKYRGLNTLFCEAKGQFTDRRFHDTQNTINVKRFFVAGFNVSKKIKPGVTCFASIDNLLARKYQSIKDYPMPGFSLTSGLKVEF